MFFEFAATSAADLSLDDNINNLAFANTVSAQLTSLYIIGVLSTWRFGGFAPKIGDSGG